MALSDAERHAIEWECAQNIVRFYNRLDGVRGEEAAALFATDDSAYTGREEIANLRTLEVHKKTSEGWKISTKRTQRELRIG